MLGVEGRSQSAVQSMDEGGDVMTSCILTC